MSFSFLSNLGNKVRASSIWRGQRNFIPFQRISVLIQRFNSELWHDSFTKGGLDQGLSRLDFIFLF